MDLVDAAAFNNATWCDAVCRALGRRTQMRDDFWANLDPSPPFYSNAISLRPGSTGSSFARVRAQVDAGVSDDWSVKDSYAALDLAGLGFEVLFEATWIGLGTRSDVATTGPTDLRWGRVTSAAALSDWEAGWGGTPGNAAARRAPRIFMPSLLGDPDIAFLAGHKGNRIEAVVIANRSDDGSGPVVGISNIVLPEDDGERHRPGVVAAVRSAFPDLPMVGYERGEDLDAMAALGFQPLGQLRVWIKS